MVRTIVSLREVNPGFDARHAVSMQVFLDSPEYAGAGSHVLFYNKLLQRLQSSPGVQYASVARGIPFEGWSGNSFVTAENPNPAKSEIPDANAIMVGPQYFQTMGLPLSQGRAFDVFDTAGKLPVAIVNQKLADEYWPHQNPIGKRLKMYGDQYPWLTVVGVARNVRTQGLNLPFFPEIYMPYMQYNSWYERPYDVVIRTVGQPLAIVPVVRQAVAELDKRLPVSDVRTMDEVADETLSLTSFVTVLLTGLSGLALCLAAVGIYGVMAYSVGQRTAEIGIRMALGAEKRDILRDVIGQGLAVAFLGSAGGVAAALGLTRLLSAQLYGVTATDPWTFVLAALLLLTVALAATYFPARRATQVDPTVALRYE